MNIAEQLAARKAHDQQQALAARERAQTTYWTAVAAAADRPEVEASDAELARIEDALAVLGLDAAKLAQDIEELTNLRATVAEHDVGAARANLAAVRQANNERAERVLALRAEIEGLEAAIAVESSGARFRLDEAERHFGAARRRAVLLVERGCSSSDVVALVPVAVEEPTFPVRALRDCTIQGHDRKRGEVFEHYGQPAGLGRYVELVDDEPAAAPAAPVLTAEHFAVEAKDGAAW